MNEPTDDPRAAQQLAALEDYWQALLACAQTDPGRWLETHPELSAVSPALTANLRLLSTMFQARQVLLEDSRVTDNDRGEPSLLQVGALVRECRIMELLGCGGMGEVYLAHHQSLDRLVAVKLLPDNLAKQPDVVQRFRNSVRLLAQLEPHAHLAWAMDAGEQDGRHFLVMEYVPGDDLKRLVQRQGPLDVARACALIRQAALGLEHAHRGQRFLAVERHAAHVAGLLVPCQSRDGVATFDQDVGDDQRYVRH